MKNVTTETAFFNVSVFAKSYLMYKIGKKINNVIFV